MSDNKTESSPEIFTSEPLRNYAWWCLLPDAPAKDHVVECIYDLELPADYPDKPENIQLEVDFNPEENRIRVAAYETIRTFGDPQNPMFSFIFGRIVKIDATSGKVHWYFENVFVETDSDANTEPNRKFNGESSADSTFLFGHPKLERLKGQSANKVLNDLEKELFNTLDHDKIDSLLRLFDYIRLEEE